MVKILDRNRKHWIKIFNHFYWGDEIFTFLFLMTRDQDDDEQTWIIFIFIIIIIIIMISCFQISWSLINNDQQQQWLWRWFYKMNHNKNLYPFYSRHDDDDYYDENDGKKSFNFQYNDDNLSRCVIFNSCGPFNNISYLHHELILLLFG